MNVDHLLDKNTVLYAIVMGFILKTVVFILGFLTVKMGHGLIRDGVKGNFKFTTEAKGIKGALQSSSPGLLFVLLGVFIMGYAMFQHKGVQLFEDALKGGKQGIEHTIGEPATEEDPAQSDMQDDRQPESDTLE
jgi:hypothetical protein